MPMFDYFVYMLVMAITPGPNTILAMVNAAQVGLKKGIWLNVGMLAGITLVSAICLAAVELLYASIPQAEIYMKALALIYMLWLAWRMLRIGMKEVDGDGTGFIQGLLLQLVNVKVYLLALTGISTYVIPYHKDIASVIAMASLIPLMCFICGLVWALGGSLLRNVFLRYRRPVSIIFALALVWCAIRICI